MVVLSRKARERQARKKNAKVSARRYKTFIPVLSDLKGKHFTGLFVCDCCGHEMRSGYVYATEEREYEICKFCNDAIFDKKVYQKVIYTPMGNKR